MCTKAEERTRVKWLVVQLMWNCQENWEDFPAGFRFKVLRACIQAARGMPESWHPEPAIEGINRSLTGHWLHKSQTGVIPLEPEKSGIVGELSGEARAL